MNLQKPNYDSPHYHAHFKGCDIEYRDIKSFTKSGKEKYRMRAEFCKTHQVVICRCGWEYKWHYGDDSKALLT